MLDKKTVRDGVRSYEARNNLQAMKKWDLCFWYHSNEWKEIVWIAQISKEAYPDPTHDPDEKWWRVVVEVKPYKQLPVPVSLEDIKKDNTLSNMKLLKQQRLSVAPVTKKEYDRITKLGWIE